MVLPHQIVTNATTLDVGRPPCSGGTKWASFKLLFHRFAYLSSEPGQYTQSPKFEFGGRKWCVRLFPGGTASEPGEYVSIFCVKCSAGSCSVSCKIVFENMVGRERNFHFAENQKFTDKLRCKGWRGIIKRSDILDEPRHYLDRNGTLAVVVSMSVTENDSSVQVPFVPRNDFISMMQGLLLDEDSADACFNVGTHEGDRGNTVFHAHRLVLRQCAPMLATLFDSIDTLHVDERAEIATVDITDVRPEVFRLLLAYVYGRSLTEEDMKIHAKDIINAADKYAIVNLKLEAEAAHVESTTITLENVIDNLLYADSKNLALLKEAVMDFLAENHDKAIKRVSFADVPGHLMKDLLVAISRNKKESKAAFGVVRGKDFDTWRVSELRMELSELGLDVDGSREAMIEALRKNSQAS